MTTQTLIFWLVLDPITFGLGSIGAYLLFKEFVEMEHRPSLPDFLERIKKRWPAFLALGIAVAYFFYRLFSVLNGRG
jgi:hypothetical protein